MALNFSKTSTQFVRNLVELGVCENGDCLNAYHPPVGVSGRSVGSAQRPKSLLSAAATTTTASGAPSTRPVIAIDVPRWIQALDSDDFPLMEVCHQLSSSEQQMSQSLESFIDELFSSASRSYGVQLETLVRALRLLERVQMTNIRAHHQLLLSQPSLRSGGSSNAVSYGSGDSAFPTTSCADPSCATLPLRSDRGARRPGLLHAIEAPTPPQLGASLASAPVPISAARPHLASQHQQQQQRYSDRSSPNMCSSSSRLNGGGLHAAPTPSATQGSAFDGSSVSSGTVGPSTDTERLSFGNGSGVPQPSSLSSWCLPTRSPCALSMSGAASPATAVGLPSLLTRLQLCSACSGSRVFALQYYNVHLLLAACLALSISINEFDVMETVTEDALMHEVAAMSHCTDLPLQMAVRVVCETLEEELCVFDSEVDALVHRLNIVDKCVFDTEGL